ncbi:hypothetical protein O7602_19890 [Micromonospora sp. WMMD1128]|uniref:hypothetical protein n=1 Tax=Micromonospora sp. WMMD1128 TaxID=3015150 RepID=UPI00248CC7FC|nr:hypothetical protein [Micromonospora sp. WMMD1128]WBB71990.1 hypothetical protein O7602_19890 [Micromonospora sp. WMMD1128]
MTARSQEIRGPLSWRNWDATAGDSHTLGEFALYADAHITGEQAAIGPMSILNTIPGFPEGDLRLSMIVRMSFGAVSIPDMARRYTATYHGGGIFDEIASLISLALGIRCKSGGMTRRWDIKQDPLGHPYEFDHKPPYLPLVDRRRPMLPGITQTVLLDDIGPLFNAYSNAAPDVATAIVRAARLYQQALWTAESDPNQAWILFVSAAEVAAEQHTALRTESPRERIEELWPEMGAALNTISEQTAFEIAELLAHLVKSTSKFVNFFLHYLPDPPLQRPSEDLQLDWSRMKRKISKVYEYRSKALHSGTPFPAPLLQPPIKVDDGPPPEVPFGISASDGTSVWMSGDLPMHLHIFEYLTRKALQSWWLQVSKRNETARPQST